MAKAEDLLNLDIAKIKSEPLREAVQDWINDYNSTSDKAAFEQESKENIIKLFDMVSRYAPEAIRSKPKSKPETKEKRESTSKSSTKRKEKPKESNGQGKSIKVAILVIGELEDILEKVKAEDLEDADIVIILELTEELEKALREGDDKKVEKIIDEMLQSFDDWQEKTASANGQAPKGTKEVLEEATNSVNKLLEELDFPPIESNGAAPSKSKSQKSYKAKNTSLRKVVKEVIKELEDIVRNIDGEVEAHLSTDMEELEAALEQDDPEKFRERVETTVKSFENSLLELEDNKVTRKATASMNKIKEALETSSSKKQGESKPDTFTRELVREVIGELTDINIDLDGEDETILATTRIDLDEALEAENDVRFRQRVEKAVESFKDFEMDIENTQAHKEAISSINKLLKALGEPEIKNKPKKTEPDKDRFERIGRELDALRLELERCRAEDEQEKKKKSSQKKPRPKPTRLTQLKTRLLSLANLIPKKLKENIGVQEKTEKILLSAHRELVGTWEMDKVKAKSGEKAIKEKFDEMEEKVNKSDRKDMSIKWRTDLSKLSQRQRDDLDKESYKEFKVDLEHLEQARKLFEEDPERATKFLKKTFDKDQLDAYLPKYIKSELQLP